MKRKTLYLNLLYSLVQLFLLFLTNERGQEVFIASQRYVTKDLDSSNITSIVPRYFSNL